MGEGGGAAFCKNVDTSSYSLQLTSSNSSNDIFPSLSLSASTIVRSVMLANCKQNTCRINIIQKSNTRNVCKYWSNRSSKLKTYHTPPTQFHLPVCPASLPPSPLPWAGGHTCSLGILLPTIMCNTAVSSSWEIKSSLSKSYILNATAKYICKIQMLSH